MDRSRRSRQFATRAAGGTIAGQTRTVLLAGGGSTYEELTNVDPPRSFSYRLSKVSGPMAILVDHVVGEWPRTQGRRNRTDLALDHPSQVAADRVGAPGVRQALEGLRTASAGGPVGGADDRTSLAASVRTWRPDARSCWPVAGWPESLGRQAFCAVSPTNRLTAARLLLDSDVLVGTSAGSAVAAQISSGRALEELFTRQVAETSAELDSGVDVDDHHRTVPDRLE